MTTKINFRAMLIQKEGGSAIITTFDAGSTEEALERVCSIHRVKSISEFHEFTLHAINPDNTITEIAVASPGKLRITGSGVANLTAKKPAALLPGPVTGLAGLVVQNRKTFTTVRI